MWPLHRMSPPCSLTWPATPRPRHHILSTYSSHAHRAQHHRSLLSPRSRLRVHHTYTRLCRFPPNAQVPKYIERSTVREIVREVPPEVFDEMSQGMQDSGWGLR